MTTKSGQEEEKKTTDSPPNGGQKEAVGIPKTNLAPRTSHPEDESSATIMLGETTMAALAGAQNAGDTIKAKNTTPKPDALHKRGISWDLGGTFSDPNNNNYYQGGQQQQQQRAGKPPVPSSSNRNNTMMPPRPPAVNSKSRMKSNDSSIGSHSPMYNPRYDASKMEEPTALELEATAFLNEVNAETNLMRNLDETDPLRPRADTGLSIMSDVPVDELEHNFVIEDPDGKVLQSKGSKESSAPSSPKSSAPNSPKSRSDRKGSERKSPVPPKTHKRDMTVEQALFGLTSALSEMKEYDKAEKKHKRGSTANTSSSNDIFDAATLLFDRTRKKNVHAKEPVEDKGETATHRPRLASTDSSKRTQPAAPAAAGGGSKWGAVRKNLGELKKTDGDADPNAELGSSALDAPVGDIEEGRDEDSEEMEYSTDDDEGSNGNSDEDKKGGGRGRKTRFSWIKKKKPNPFRHLPGAAKIMEEWDTFNNFLNPRKKTLYTYIKIILLYIMVPSAAIAAILFYLVENPPTGYCPYTGCDDRFKYPSASWWVLFIGCRQVVIACLSKLTESFIVDFLALRTRFTLKLFGPMFTLLLVQSKGWPFLIFCFGMYNFALVVGDSRFSNHWLFWQEWIKMCNGANPPGLVTSSQAFYRICACAMVVGSAVAIKRVAVGLYLGRKTFANYSKQLTSVINKMLTLNELARFGKAVEEREWTSSKKGINTFGKRSTKVSDERLSELLDIANQQSEDDNLTFTKSKSSKSVGAATTVDEMEKVINPDDVDPYTGGLSMTQKQRISDLLGQWEEPARNSTLGDVSNLIFAFHFLVSCG